MAQLTNPSKMWGAKKIVLVLLAAVVIFCLLFVRISYQPSQSQAAAIAKGGVAGAHAAPGGGDPDMGGGGTTSVTPGATPGSGVINVTNEGGEVSTVGYNYDSSFLVVKVDMPGDDNDVIIEYEMAGSQEDMSLFDQFMCSFFCKKDTEDDETNRKTNDKTGQTTESGQ